MAETSESNPLNRSKIKKAASDWDDPVLLTFKNAVLSVLKLIYEKDRGEQGTLDRFLNFWP